jgi:hypothetical protein
MYSLFGDLISQGDEKGFASLMMLGEGIAKNSFIEDLKGPSSPTSRGVDIGTAVKYGIDDVLKENDLLVVSDMTKGDMKEFRAAINSSDDGVKFASGKLGNMFGRSRAAGGMSSSTLDNLIKSSIEAARVMR